MENQIDALPETRGAGRSIEERLRAEATVRLVRRQRRIEEVARIGGAVHLHIEEQLGQKERSRRLKKSR